MFDVSVVKITEFSFLFFTAVLVVSSSIFFSCFSMICGEPDSWKHSLIECNLAKCVWALALGDITELITSIQEPHTKGWLATIFNALSHEESTRVVVTLWVLSYVKRKAILKGIFQGPLLTNCFIGRFFADLELTKPAKQGVKMKKGEDQNVFPRL
jgi:hypothetical protein